mgnify:CR=1 FL=1
MLQLLDATIFPLLMLVSSYLVFRFKWGGFIASFLLIWFIPYLWGLVLSEFDKERIPLLDHLWPLTGWIASSIWCGILLTIRFIPGHKR